MIYGRSLFRALGHSLGHFHASSALPCKGHFRAVLCPNSSAFQSAPDHRQQRYKTSHRHALPVCCAGVCVGATGPICSGLQRHAQGGPVVKPPASKPTLVDLRCQFALPEQQIDFAQAKLTVDRLIDPWPEMVLAANPRETVAMVHKASAYRPQLQGWYVNKYPWPVDIPRDKQADFQLLDRENLA